MTTTPIVPDTTIKWKIQQAVSGDPRTAHSNVGIAVQGGAVSLSGQVDTLTQKLLLSSLAFRVPGVTAIADAVTVEVAQGHADVDIATAASLALRAAVNIPEDSIHIVVDDGIVTLTGSVAWDFQREAARRAVNHLAGVRIVFDNVLLEPRPHRGEVVRQLEAAFARSACLRDRSLRVGCDDGIVTLWGTVHSWHERREAIKAAWSATGTTEVICRLETVYSGQDALMV